MHIKISTQISILPSLLIFALMTQETIAAVPTTKPIPAPGGFVAGQGGSVNATVLKTVPTLTLVQAEQSVRRSGAQNVFLLVDTNGDGQIDSALRVPRDTPGAVTLDQALNTLRAHGGDGHRYVAIDTDGDGNSDSILAMSH
ncbi:MAG: hypothetical protein HYX35_00180 [Proteobacteria bacterium]|nr:hypothetical protein [Pseudomonadota bacterium]